MQEWKQNSSTGTWKCAKVEQKQASQLMDSLNIN